MRALFQMTDKEIEDMTLDELRIEYAVHSWAAKKQETNIFVLNRHVHWAKENTPPIDLEEEKAKWKRGEITANMYSTRCSQNAARIRDEKATQLKLLYAKEMMEHERAVCAIISEQMEIVKHRKSGRKRGPKPRDPSKRAGRNNAKVDWREKHPVMQRQKPLKSNATYWAEIREKNHSATAALHRMAPIETWDYEKLRTAARAAGFYSEEMILVNVARELELTTRSAKKILESGKFSWGQAMLIGALFEMSPAIFCDVFMNGYFKEIASGKFVAKVEDKEALRDIK